MCGIVGFVTKKGSSVNEKLLYNLILESTIRGLHCFGFATDKKVEKFMRMINKEAVPWFFEAPAGLFHSRYSTSGDWHDMRNNQPLCLGKTSLAMNGVISMKPREEYEKEYGVKCNTENDSEIFLQLLEKGSKEAISQTKGAWAAIWLREGKVFAARNTYRPLFWFRQGSGAYLCSTTDIAYRSGIDYAEPVPTGEEFCLNDAL